MSEWISVEDRLPDTGIGEKDYSSINVIAYNGRLVLSCVFSEGQTAEYWNAFSADEVTHWMPLPEPPKDKP